MRALRGILDQLAIKVILIVGLILVCGFILTLPNRTYQHSPDSHPTVDGFSGFSGPENHPDGYRYAWGLAGASLLYPNVPRYSPLNLHLRLNLQRPAGIEPGRLEIYENTSDPPDQPRLITTLTYNPSQNGPQDFYISVPARSGGEGLFLELRSNTFQVAKDNRQLGFLFLGSEISLPKSHLRYLFWPQPYWLAGLLLLAALAAWSLRAGLTFFESLLLTGLSGFALTTMTSSTYQHSWWLLLIAALIWLVYGWESYNLRHKQAALKWSVWPTLTATALLIGFFLFSADYNIGDIVYYFHWSASVHDNGLWNIYNYDSKLDYPPLVVYVLWFYDLVVYPFGWQESQLAWRIFASLMFMAVVALVYRVSSYQLSAVSRQPSANPTAPNLDSQHPTPSTQHSALSTPFSSFILHPSSFIILVAFNAALFYNPTVWGQSDMLAVLALVLAFYLVIRCQVSGVRYQVSGISKNPTDPKPESQHSALPFHPSSFILHPSLAGLAIGMAAISKPQAWFVVPLLAWLLLQRTGWKRGGLGLTLGAGAALTMAGIAFGLDFKAIGRYLGQAQFAGEYKNENPAAYNLNYLLLGSTEGAPPTWLSLLGFAVVAIVLLTVLYFSARHKNHPNQIEQFGLGASLLVVTCFSFLIKMKERYLIYGLPFLGLGALSNRRLIKPFLALSWLQMIHMVIGLFQFGRSRTHTLPDNFFWWSSLLSQDLTKRLISVGTLGLFLWLATLYLSEVLPKQPKLTTPTETPAQEVATP
jgi:hypothetical protein